MGFDEFVLRGIMVRGFVFFSRGVPLNCVGLGLGVWGLVVVLWLVDWWLVLVFGVGVGGCGLWSSAVEGGGYH